ncbi:dorsal-ventral patterning protein tolloid-like [Tropilaelaps mercedesae]|uniref:Dorsal-ventral patterning protein tolloid-like n=1 Tax=Tropilaelaps mercedesae TaxID=418985 RepID=A0A1V9XLV9_9ACAR|nr:dorsal-ventral patterning protein tolloid-like [Tropilaelaps mercedesae]
MFNYIFTFFRFSNKGYMQIVDGYARETNISNRDSPGFYCGEIDSPKTFISETPYVKVVFHVDAYEADTYMHFEATVKQQQEVASRYGQYSNLYPHRRGQPVANTYCQRLFKDCAPGRCFVQSPAYPGIYPRNLNCRYRISVRQSLVGLDLVFFDVDGLRCDNLLMCFPRPISREPSDCPFDYVRIHDGPTDDHPVIATLCGRGRLKSNIVASGSEMLVTFVTSPAGPLLNTGFHFKADSVYDSGEGETIQLHRGGLSGTFSRVGPSGSCVIQRALSAAPSTFNSIRSWYSANTSCQFRLSAPPGGRIRVAFSQFRVERVTFCAEAVRIYDAAEPDPRFILSKASLCDTNRPAVDAPRAEFESSSNRMLVDFTSTVGSLDGSSITFSFEARHVSPPPIRNNRTQKLFSTNPGCHSHNRKDCSSGEKTSDPSDGSKIERVN